MTTLQQRIKSLFRNMHISFDRWRKGTTTHRLDGIDVIFPNGEESETVGARIDDERPVITEFIGSIQSGDVVYDIGAQYGLFGCIAGQAAESVSIVAFEPFPGPLYRTRLNLEANDVSAVAIEAALTDHENNLPEWLSKVDLPSQETLWAGDSLREERGLPQPNVIKMDIEGAEKFALEGLAETLSNQDLRVLFVEIHPQGCFSRYPDRFEDVGLTPNEIEEVKDQLARAGFSITTVHSRDEQDFLKATR